MTKQPHWSKAWRCKAWLDNRYNYFEVSGNSHKSHRATRIGIGPLDLNSLKWTTSITCPSRLGKVHDRISP